MHWKMTNKSAGLEILDTGSHKIVIVNKQSNTQRHIAYVKQQFIWHETKVIFQNNTFHFCENKMNTYKISSDDDDDDDISRCMLMTK